MNKNWLAAALALICVISTAPASAAQEVSRPDSPLRDFIAGKGGRLSAGQSDVVVVAHGTCRWLDNNSDQSEYFIPLGSPLEWKSFIDYAPPSVVRASCCLPQQVRLTSTDGQSVVRTLPTGRDGANDSRGIQLVSHAFNMVRAADGATWTQTVSQRFTCVGETWVGDEVLTSGEEPPVVVASGDTDTRGAWTVGAWSQCQGKCGTGQKTRTVSCSFTRCVGAKPASSETCRIDDAVNVLGYCYYREGGGDRLTCSNRCAARGKQCAQSGLDVVGATDASCGTVINALLPNLSFGGSQYVGTHMVNGCYIWYPWESYFRTQPGQRVAVGRSLRTMRSQTCDDWLIGNYGYPCPCE